MRRAIGTRNLLLNDSSGIENRQSDCGDDDGKPEDRVVSRSGRARQRQHGVAVTFVHELRFSEGDMINRLSFVVLHLFHGDSRLQSTCGGRASGRGDGDVVFGLRTCQIG